MAKSTEADEMFAAAGNTDDPFAGMDDLLDSVEEDDAEAWVAKNEGDAIAGIFVKHDKTKSDFAAENEDPYVPVWVIENADGKFRITGYASMLKREMNDAVVNPGDKVAVKFFGNRPLKTGKFAGRPFAKYGVVVAPNPAPAYKSVAGS